MILYIRDPKESTQEQKPIRADKHFVQSDRIQSKPTKTRSLPVHNDKHREKEIRGTIPFLIAPFKNKIFMNKPYEGKKFSTISF